MLGESEYAKIIAEYSAADSKQYLMRIRIRLLTTGMIRIRTWLPN
jgi:hypothetical protein